MHKSACMHVQGLDNSIASMRSACDRDMQQQASLRADAEAHARSVTDRDSCVREVAALCGISDLAGTMAMSDEELARCVRVCVCACVCACACVCMCARVRLHHPTHPPSPCWC